MTGFLATLALAACTANVNDDVTDDTGTLNGDTVEDTTNDDVLMPDDTVDTSTGSTLDGSGALIEGSGSVLY